MSGTIDKKLEELGIALPTPAAPIANYVGFVRTGRLLFVSGQLCLAEHLLLRRHLHADALHGQVLQQQHRRVHRRGRGDLRCHEHLLVQRHVRHAVRRLLRQHELPLLDLSAHGMRRRIHL